MKRTRFFKRIIAFILLITIITGGISIPEKEVEAADSTVKAVWISCIEIRGLMRNKTEAEFKSIFTEICNNVVANNCNTIYYHVRPNADATYPSQYFPWSLNITSTGKALSYDPLKDMISIAKSKGLKFYAWVNPYMISSVTSKTTSLLNGTYSSAYQAKFNEWYKQGIVTRQTYNSQDCLFFDPNNEAARTLVVNGVKEIITNYSVDGIIFDDFFFCWDTATVSSSGIAARKKSVNALIKRVYSTIKSVNSNIQFGISPEGNLDNARRQGCDIDTWLSESGYIDFIAPQLYWTDQSGSSGTITRYSSRLNAWLALVKNGTPVYPALAIYQAGQDLSYDKGWTSKTTNMQEQWTIAKNKGCTGFSLYSYTYMLTTAGKKEMANLNKITGSSANSLNAVNNPNINYVYDDASIKYTTHVQDYGWQDIVTDGSVAGTSGRSKRLESIKIDVDSDYSGSITYRTHVQDKGWIDWVSDGAESGTTGQSKRLEAIEIKLTGELAEKFDVYYRVHAQDYGWLGWAKNGETAGTTGKSKRLEAIEIVLVRKGGSAPGSTAQSHIQTLVQYTTHVQSYGWQGYVSDGALSGTSGQSKRLEAIRINLANQKYSGGITYRVHCQSRGWMNWVSNGALSGTTGESKRLEAIEIKLTGEMDEHYDVYYRVHVQDHGWQAWVKNGETAGTTGRSKRLEAIEIKLVPKE